MPIMLVYMAMEFEIHRIYTEYRNNHTCMTVYFETDLICGFIDTSLQYIMSIKLKKQL